MKPGGGSGTSGGAGSDAGGFGNRDSSIAELDASVSGGGSGGTGGSSGDDDGGLSSGNSCGMGKAEAKLKPVNMFVMFDRSSSMNDNNKWTNATAALDAFFGDPTAAGLRVALRFFPHDMPAAGCSKNGCDATACSMPLVPIGELTKPAAPTDAQEDALKMAIASSAPGGGGGGGGTPISAALDGALQWSATYQLAHPDEATVVVFVTDGEPNGCDENFDNISKLAADTLAANGVSTYAIGLQGANETQMDQLAVAGGTKAGIFVDTSANAQQELLDALNGIRGETLSCDFPLPKPTDPKVPIDPTKINVTFTPSGGKAATLRQVTADTKCATSKAWYYDDPKKPKRIVLCPSACELVRSQQDAKLDILVGCKTVCGGLDVDCGGDAPPDVPPIIPD